MTKKVRQVGDKVAARPAPAARPPEEIAPAMTAATTKFFTSGKGLNRGVYAEVRATDATMVAWRGGRARGHEINTKPPNDVSPVW